MPAAPAPRPGRSRSVAPGALLALASACASPRTVLEIPLCADRVEVVGEATRVSPRVFVLDHGLDLPLSRAVIVFEAGGRSQRVELVSTEPDAVRLFGGAVSAVAGGFVWSRALEAPRRAPVSAEEIFMRHALGGALVAGGVLLAATGWHPPERSVSFPDACSAPPPPP